MITVQFEGQEHHFPDDFTDDEIGAALDSVQPLMPATQTAPTDASGSFNQNARPGEYQHTQEGLSSSEAALLPRLARSMHEDGSIGRGIAAVGADVLSLPGRTVASGVDAATGGPGFAEGMRDTEGSGFLGHMVRDPATGAMVAATVASGGILAPALAASMASQVDNMGNGENFNPLEAAEDVALNYAGGKAGELAFGAIAKGGKSALNGAKSTLTKMTEGRAANVTNKLIKPTKAEISRGYEQGTLKEFNIVGDIEGAATQTKSLVEAEKSKLRKALVEASKADNGANMIDGRKLLAEVPKRPGYAKEYDAVQKELNERLTDISENGMLNVEQGNEFKGIIGEMRDFKGPSVDLPEKDKILGQLYHVVNKDVKLKADAFGGDIAAANANLSKLYPVRNVLKKRLAAIDETADEPGMLSKLGGAYKEIEKQTSKNLPLEMAAHFIGVPYGVISGLKMMNGVTQLGLDKLSMKLARDASMQTLAKEANISTEHAIRASIVAQLSGKAMADAIRDVADGSDGPENYIEQDTQKRAGTSQLFDAYGNIGS